MIRVEAVVTRVQGVGRADLEDWIARGWLAPVGDPPDWSFPESELARVRLVRDLRQDVGIAEDTLAVVLTLLDQIADLRHALARLTEALGDLPADQRDAVLHRVRQ